MKTLAYILTKYIFLIFCTLFAIANILVTTYQINNDLLIENHVVFGLTRQHIFFVCIVFILGYLLYQSKISNRRLLVFILSLFFVVGLYWILSNALEPENYSDAFKCFRDAKLILNGNYSPFDFKSYINKWPHNLGIISYFMFHIRLFGDNAYLSLRFVNLLLAIAAYFSLYKISEQLFGEKVARIVILFILFNFQLVFLSYDIYGYVASFSTIIISLLFLVRYIQKNKNIDLCLMYVFILFAILIKNNALIVCLAESIYLFFHLLSRNRWKAFFLIGLLFIGQYIVTTGVIRFYENRIRYSISHNKLPKIMWIAIGLNYEEKHIGGYFELAEIAHERNDFVVEYTKKDAMEYIHHCVTRFKNNPSKIYDFYSKKFFQAYTNPEYDTFKFFRDIDKSQLNQRVISGDINNLIKNILDASSTLVSMGLILSYRKIKKLTWNQLVLAMVIVGGFLFHMIWEIKAIYMYIYFLLLLPYAALFVENGSIIKMRKEIES